MIEEIIESSLTSLFQHFLSEMSYPVGRGRAYNQPKAASTLAGRAGKAVNAAKPTRSLVPGHLIRNLEVTQAAASSEPAPPRVYPGGYDDDDDDDEEDWNDDPNFKSFSHPQVRPTATSTHASGVPSGFRPAGYEDDEDEFNIVATPSSGATSGTSAKKVAPCPAGYESDEYDEFEDLNLAKPQKPPSPITEEEKLSAIFRENPTMNPEFLKSLLSHNPTLNTVQFDNDPISAKWLETIENEWLDRRPTLQRDVARILRDCYHVVDNPYRTALYLMSKAKDFYQGKTSGLHNVAIREFENWIRNNELKVEHHLDDDLKLFAFQVAVKKHTTCLDPVMKAFRLDEAEPTLFLPYVKYMLAKKMYKEAANCITKLKLHDHFALEDVILPLVLQDKVNLVEAYVYRNKKQQEELVMLLDSLCDKDLDLSVVFLENKHVPDIQRDKLQPKIISKLAIRLMKLYNISAEKCPHINRHGKIKALRYLLYRRFIEKALNDQNWDELVLAAVNDNKDLQLVLIDGCVDHLEMEEGARWAVHFDLPHEELPGQVVDYLHSAAHDGTFQPIVGSEDWEEEDWGDGGDTTADEAFYHQMSLPREEIYFVTNKEEFYQSLGYLNKENNIIGLDAEWKPGIGVAHHEKVALLQAADANRAYLYDVISLSVELEDSDWEQWGLQILATDSILKLGFGFESDYKVLSRSIPGIAQPLKDCRRFVEILDLKNAILRVCPDAFDRKSASLEKRMSKLQVTNKKEEVGLSCLVRQCLGRPLDKTQQMSNWEVRPLRNAQVIYAALDAFVLLEVYKVLKDMIKQYDLQVPLETHATRQPAKLSKQQRKQRRVAQRPEGSISGAVAAQNLPEMKVTPLGPPITPKELSVVTDTMLQGLGRHLRCCGVDVICLENNQDHDDCGKIARRDNRIILTSGQPYQYLKSQVPEGRCINVATGKARDQVLYILKLFNVTVTKNDIFSRCQMCNGDSYLQISPTDMKNAWIRKSNILSQMKTDPSTKPPWKLLLEKRKDDKDNEQSKSVGKNPYVKTPSDVKYHAIDMETLTVGNHVPIQVEVIPKPLLDKIELFYCCATCGKVFWEGTHFDKVCDQFSYVLDRK